MTKIIKSITIIILMFVVLVICLPNDGFSHNYITHENSDKTARISYDVREDDEDGCCECEHESANLSNEENNQYINMRSSQYSTCNSISSSHGSGRELGYSSGFLAIGCANYKGISYTYGTMNIPFYIDLNTMTDAEANNVRNQIKLWNEIEMHDGSGRFVNLYEVNSTNNVDGRKVIIVSQENIADAGVFNQYNLTVKLSPNMNIDTPLHEFGHVLGLGDLDADDSIPNGTHDVLMGYSRGTTMSTLNQAIRYQDIQGVAVLNSVHTNHQYLRYVENNGQYVHLCFYCDKLEISSIPLDDSSSLELASTCLHDYQQMVSAGDRHWLKCIKCYKVVESDFFIKGIDNKGIIGLEINGIINHEILTIDIPAVIGGQTVISIGAEAFVNSHCTSVSLPYTLVSIGEKAFMNCNLLTSIYLPSKVENIGVGAFGGCYNLSISLSLSNSYFCVLNNIIYDSSTTKIIAAGNIDSNILINENVVEILPHAFENNSNLECIRFLGTPNICEYSFNNCENLRNVYFDSYEAPYLGDYSFSNNNFDLYVKYNSIELYEDVFYVYTSNIMSVEILIIYISDDSILETESVYNGSTIQDLLLPFKKGYTFNGWYSNEIFDGTCYQNGDLFESETDIYLYANWSVNNYEVTLNPNGGIIIGNNCFTVTFDETFSTTVLVERAGYSFEGWYDSEGTQYITSEGIGTVLWNKDTDTTLYASWSIEKYEIKINDNGTVVWLGANGISSSSCSIEYGTVLSAINLVNTFKNSSYGYKDGKIFDHFEYDDYIIQWDSIPDLGSNDDIIVITPVWILEQHTIYFNPKCDMTVLPLVFDYNETITLPSISRIGYTFEGWYKISSDEKVVWEKMPDLSLNEQTNGSIQLEAKWRINTYIVSYNKNGGTGTMSSTDHIYNLEKTLRLNTFYKTGHDFIGWSTDPDGVVEYIDGENVINMTNLDGVTITLYAVWEAKEYNIVYKNLTTNMVVYVKTYTYGIGLSEMPTIYCCGNYHCNELENFDGWYSDANFTTKVNSISKTRTGTVTLYAKYDLWIMSTYASYTSSVNDGNINNQPSFSIDILLDSIYFEQVQNTSLSKIKIEISFDMWEVDDGYQHIYLYNGNSQIWSDTIERGSGINSSSYHYTNTIYLDLEDYSNVDYLDLKFSASGWFDDDWKFNNFEMHVYFTN